MSNSIGMYPIKVCSLSLVIFQDLSEIEAPQNHENFLVSEIQKLISVHVQVSDKTNREDFSLKVNSSNQIRPG